MIGKSIINRLDQNFDDAVKSIKFKYSKSDLIPELREQRREIADADDFEFCKIYFPQIFNDQWNDMHRSIKKIKKGIHTRSGSRYFGKSAFTYVTKIVKPLCLGGNGIVGLGLRNQDVATARTQAIMRLIKNNELLKYDYNIKIQRDRIGDYLVNNKQFVGFGFREGLRNFFTEEFKRFDYIVLDDLFNAQTINSTPDNEKILTFVESECTGQLNEDGLLIWLFNYVSIISPGYIYAQKHPENHFNLPALNEKGETNWPGSKRWTTKKLLKKRDELSFEVWMGDWMNSPLQKGEEFEKDWLRGVNINTLKILASISVIDPAHGESPQACYKSIITMGYTDKKKYVIQDIYLRKESYFQFFNYLHNISVTTPAWKVALFENDFAQWNMARPYYNLWKKETKRSIAIQKFNSKELKTQNYSSDKESRIRNLILPFEVGEIIFNQDLLEGKNKDYDLWFAQYLGFGKLKGKLDGLDATASAYILFPRYIARGSFKPLNTKFTKKESWLFNR